MSKRNKYRLNGTLRPRVGRRAEKRAVARAESEKAQADLAAQYAAEDVAGAAA